MQSYLNIYISWILSISSLFILTQPILTQQNCDLEFNGDWEFDNSLMLLKDSQSSMEIAKRLHAKSSE